MQKRNVTLRGVEGLGLLFLVLAVLLAFLVPPVSLNAQNAPAMEQKMAPPASSPDFDAAMKLYRQRRYAAAIEQFNKITEADPGNAAAYYFAGYSHYVMKHLTQAQESFNKAFQANPSFDPRPYFRGR